MSYQHQPLVNPVGNVYNLSIAIRKRRWANRFNLAYFSTELAPVIEFKKKK